MPKRQEFNSVGTAPRGPSHHLRGAGWRAHYNGIMHAAAAGTARDAARFPGYRRAGFHRAHAADNLGVVGVPPLHGRQNMRLYP